MDSGIECPVGCDRGALFSPMNAAMGGGLYISCGMCNGTGRLMHGPPKPPKPRLKIFIPCTQKRRWWQIRRHNWTTFVAHHPSVSRYWKRCSDCGAEGRTKTR